MYWSPSAVAVLTKEGNHDGIVWISPVPEWNSIDGPWSINVEQAGPTAEEEVIALQTAESISPRKSTCCLVVGSTDDGLQGLASPVDQERSLRPRIIQIMSSNSAFLKNAARVHIAEITYIHLQRSGRL